MFWFEINNLLCHTFCEKDNANIAEDQISTNKIGSDIDSLKHQNQLYAMLTKYKNINQSKQ